MKCNQCEALVINGVFCHETGCPNQRKKWINDEWTEVYTCDYCGYEYPVDEPCNCYEEYN